MSLSNYSRLLLPGTYIRRSAGRKSNKEYQVGLMGGITVAAEILVSEEPWIEELQKIQQTQNNLHELDSNHLRTY